MCSLDIPFARSDWFVSLKDFLTPHSPQLFPSPHLQTTPTSPTGNQSEPDFYNRSETVPNISPYD